MNYELSAELKPILNWQPKPRFFAAAPPNSGRAQHPLLPCLHGSAGIPSHSQPKVVEYAIKAGLALNCKIIPSPIWTEELCISRFAESLPDFAI